MKAPGFSKELCMSKHTAVEEPLEQDLSASASGGEAANVPVPEPPGDAEEQLKAERVQEEEDLKAERVQEEEA
jgi:hypothetical protein